MCLALAIAASLPLASAPATNKTSLPVEVRTRLERTFARLDRDRNGLITANEAPRRAQPRCGAGDTAASPGDWLSLHDANGDNQVSAQEFVEHSLGNSGRSARSPRLSGPR
jgi:Ca2+-binding EF-hand superfamily protein